MVDERHFLLLKRKLQALNYNEPVDVSSFQLVEHLVNDLVHTTESYRSLKLQVGQQQHHEAESRNKIEVIRKESARVVHENNSLHVQLIKEAEKFDQQRTQHYKRVKELENEISELSFWKHQALDRFAGFEKENEKLKERIQELLKLGKKGIPVQDQAKITLTYPMDHVPVYRNPSIPAEEISLLQAVEARYDSREISLLEHTQRHVKDCELELAQLHSQAELLQLSVKRRDEEIVRLQKRVELGNEMDSANLAIRNETNESIILSLNQQVDLLASQIAELEGKVKEQPQLEHALATMLHEKTEAEKKLHAAMHENQAIQEQVAALKLEVLKIKAEAGKRTRNDKQDTRGVLEQVTNLQGKLADATMSQDSLRLMVHTTEKQRDMAKSKEIAYKEELACLHASLEAIRAERDALQQQADDLARQMTSLKTEVREKAAAAVTLQHRCTTTLSQKEALEEQVSTLTIQLEESNARISSLQMYLDSAKDQKTETGKGQAALQARLQEAVAEKGRLTSRLSSMEEDRSSLQLQLREAVRGRTAAEGQQAQLEEERDRLQREQTSLRTRLDSCTQRLDEMSSDRDSLDLDLTRLRRELSLVQEERSVLQEDLARSRKQWQEHRERLATTEGELGHLTGLRDRSEVLQSQLKDYSQRLSTAESEQARMKSEVERWRLATGEAEDKLLALTSSLRDAERQRTELRGRLQEVELESTKVAGALQAAEANQKALIEEKERARSLAEIREESLSAERAKVQQLTFQLRSVENKTDTHMQRATVRDEELSRMRAMLDEAQKTVEVWQGKQRESAAEIRTQSEKARHASALADEYESELRITRSQVEDGKRDLLAMQERFAKINSELEAHRAEIDQLKSLTLVGDQSQQELHSRLSSQATELRACQLKVQLQQEDLTQRLHLYEDAKRENSDLQAVIRQLDGERDKLQVELDSKLERLTSVEESYKKEHAKAGALEQALTAAERRLVNTDRHIAELEHELQTAAQREDIAHQNLVALQQDYERLQEENGALSEDLAVMVKENQLVSGQLSNSAQHVDDARDELRTLQSNLGVATQTLKARELELEDMRHAYEEVAGENRQLQSSITQLKRQMSGQAMEMEAAKQEVLHMQEAHHSGQAQMQQYVVDIQALERNNDALSRELHGSKQESEDIARERNRVIEQMQAAQAMRYEAERGRDALQREVASLDSQLHIANARLNETHAEVRGMMTKLQLQQNRIHELEQLLEGMRAREFNKNLIGAPTDSAGVLQLQEKVTLLETQNGDLTAQMHAIQDKSVALEAQLQRSGSHDPQVSNLEAALADAERNAAELRADKERLLSMVSRLELDKSRLQQARSLHQTTPGTSASMSLSPGSSSDTEWRARVRSLETEKQQLAENVASLHEVLATMQRQLGNIHGEYSQIPSMSPAITQEFSSAMRYSASPDENRDP